MNIVRFCFHAWVVTLVATFGYALPAQAVGCLVDSGPGPVLHVHDASGNLASVNLDTGDGTSSVTVIGQMDSVMTDIAFDGNGRLYAIDFDRLYEINPFDASTRLIGPHGVGGANALVFSPDGGTLFLASFVDTQLYTVDRESGVATAVAQTGFASAGDLAFVEDQLYLSSTAGDLIALNPAGAEPIGSVVGATGFQNVFGLATGGNGTLYGIAGTSVFSIDTQTGSGTEVLNYGNSDLSSSNGSSFFDEAGQDSDCDGLWDVWETVGFTTQEGVFIDYPAMGSDPLRADVYVQVDAMEGFEPRKAALDEVIDVFDRSPFMPPNCPTCRPGVSLHLDAGPEYVMNPVNGELWGDMSQANVVPHVEELGEVIIADERETYAWSCSGDEVCFDQIKLPDNFSAARQDSLFHYALYADRKAGNRNSGISRGAPARDFIVFAAGLNEVEERGTFMHEFGHNLGLLHGGNENENYKPNYLSVMNYTFQFGGLEGPEGSGLLDFSRSELGSLNEDALDEDLQAVAPGTFYADYMTKYWCESELDPDDSEVGVRIAELSEPIDWDCDGSINVAAVASDVNRSADAARSELTGSDDWTRLLFAGGTAAALSAGLPLAPPQDQTENIEPEIALLRQVPSQDRVRIVATDAVIRSSDGSVGISVRNEGLRDSRYAAIVTSPDGTFTPVAPAQDTFIAAGATGEITIDIGEPQSQERAGALIVSLRQVGNEMVKDSQVVTVLLEAAAPVVVPPPPPSSGGGGGGLGVCSGLLLGVLVWRRRSVRRLAAGIAGQSSGS